MLLKSEQKKKPHTVKTIFPDCRKPLFPYYFKMKGGFGQDEAEAMTDHNISKSNLG